MGLVNTVCFGKRVNLKIALQLSVSSYFVSESHSNSALYDVQSGVHVDIVDVEGLGGGLVFSTRVHQEHRESVEAELAVRPLTEAGIGI